MSPLPPPRQWSLGHAPGASQPVRCARLPPNFPRLSGPTIQRVVPPRDAQAGSRRRGTRRHWAGFVPRLEAPNLCKWSSRGTASASVLRHCRTYLVDQRLRIEDRRDQLHHRDHVEHVVMEDGNEPVRLSVLDVVVVEARDFEAPDIAGPALPKHTPFECLQLAIGQLGFPAAARHPEKIEMRDLERERQAMVNRAITKEWNVERFAVEGHEKIDVGEQAAELAQERGLFRVVPREELAKNEGRVTHEGEPDQKHRHAG